MRPKKCIFCKKSPPHVKITKEHVLRRKLKKLFDFSNDGGTHWERSFIALDGSKVERRVVPQTAFDFTVNDVCKVCNEGWLNVEVEVPAYEVLKSLIKGDPVSVPVPAANQLATWAAKTALVRACMEPLSVVPEGHYDWMMEKLLPPPNTSIWIARAAAGPHTWVRFMQAGLLENTSDTFYLATFRLGALVLFVVGCSTENAANGFNLKAIELDHKCFRIWPKVESGISEIPFLSDESMVAVAGGEFQEAGRVFDLVMSKRFALQVMGRQIRNLFKW